VTAGLPKKLACIQRSNDDHDKMTLEEAFAHALNGDAFLFLGAGFSKGAFNVQGLELKIGSALTELLAAQSGAPVGATLEDAAEAFVKKSGSSALVDLLKKEFTVSRVAAHHLTLADVPWLRVYTTNYDNAFEFAAHEVNRIVQPVTIEADPFDIHAKHIVSVHLNGYIGQLTPEKLATTFKLTETSYVTASISESPWAMRLREDIRLARAAFFVGYSLYDLDVKRILAENADLKAKCFFVSKPEANQLLEQRVERFGSYLPIGGEQFASRLKNFSYRYRPPSRHELNLRSLAEVFPCRSSRRPVDQDLLNLFELGDVDEMAIAASLAQGIPYYLHRSKLPKIIELLKGGAKAVAVSASLGNGKTLLLKELEVWALQEGYRVFRTGLLTENAALECERVANEEGKILLIVDNYQNWLNEIRAFRQIKSDHKQLVVTARDSVHDVFYDKLESECGLTSIAEISLNRLDDLEIEWFVRTLDQFGLWRSLAGRSIREKTQILKTNYTGQIHGILLGLLQSHDIGERVLKLFAETEKNKSFQEVIASVFILNVLNQSPTIDLLQDLWGITLLSSTAFKENAGVRQLLNFDEWQVRVRSSVISEFILRSGRTVDLVPIISKMARHAAAGVRAVPRYRALFNELTKFSSVQRILPESGRLGGTIRYFESIKDIELNRRSPLFWLQFAIGCLVGDDLKRAKIYFDTAYSLADSRDFDTYQIDNHFARYLLIETANAGLPIGSAIQNFREARSIINRQLAQRDRMHYPYRVACGYQDFVDKFGPKLSADVCNELAVAAKHVLERIKTLTEEQSSVREVRRCFEAMNYVVKRCDELIRSGSQMHSRS